MNGLTVYSEAVAAASVASATVVEVAAVIPILNIFERTVRKLETDETFFLCLEVLGFGIGKGVLDITRRVRSDWCKGKPELKGAE